MVLDYFRWFWILTMGNTLCDGHGMAFQFDWDEEFPLRWDAMWQDTPWGQEILQLFGTMLFYHQSHHISDPFPIHFDTKKDTVCCDEDWTKHLLTSKDVIGIYRNPWKKNEAMIFTHPRRPEEDLRLQIKVPWRTEKPPDESWWQRLDTSPLL
jgi:hypothetical protein